MKKDVNELSKATIDKMLEKLRNYTYARRKGGLKGGKSRWESMSEEDRVKHIQKMNKARKLNKSS